MQKLTAVKATNLKIGDRIKIAGQKYRVSRLFHHFGGPGTGRVVIHAYPIEKQSTFMNIAVRETARFDIRRPSK